MKRWASVFGAALAGFVLSAGGAASADGNWVKKAPLPAGMAEVGVVALDRKIYVIGGTEQRVTEKGKSPPIWASTLNMMYDPALDAWQERAPLPNGLSHVGVAALGGKIYVIGGFTNIIHMGAQDRAFVYDPQADKWSELAKLSNPRGSVAAAAVGGKLHIFGGRTPEKLVKVPMPPGMPETFAAFGTLNTHDIFDPATGIWSKGTPMPSPARDHMGVAVIDGKVHLFGGRVADVVDNIAQHDVYDPIADSWTSAAPLPGPRSSGAATVLNGRILYAGGECKPGGQPFSPNAYDDVTAYDPKTNSWSDLTPLPQARHAFGAATVEGTAYFVGGAPVCGGGAVTDTLAFKF